MDGNPRCKRAAYFPAPGLHLLPALYISSISVLKTLIDSVFGKSAEHRSGRLHRLRPDNCNFAFLPLNDESLVSNLFPGTVDAVYSNGRHRIHQFEQGRFRVKRVAAESSKCRDRVRTLIPELSNRRFVLSTTLPFFFKGAVRFTVRPYRVAGVPALLVRSCEKGPQA